MQLEEGWFNEKLARRCLDALKRNNIAGYYAPNRSKALTQILEMIPPKASIGIGDSVTLLQVGVITVVGINKIVANLEEAMERIKKVAAPINAYRHHIKHDREVPPCAITGVCVDCRHPRRICNYTLVVEYQTRPRIEVIIVGEELGI
ncbi:LUD domain-containing protein [Chloroflexota bacterium]